MYYYYSIATLGGTVWWKKYITIAQMTQFAIDMIGTWPYLIFNFNHCTLNVPSIWFGQAIGVSFLFLFYQLYVDIYDQTKTKGKAGQIIQKRD